VGYKRSPKLEDRIEIQLAEQMKTYWNAGLTAKQIAKKLHFGESTTVINGKEEPNPYVKLKFFHVWFYRSKFNEGSFTDNQGLLKYKHLKPFKGKFPKRKGYGIQKGKPRYKVKLKETMYFPEFKAKLNEKLPYSEYVDIRKRRAFLILQYWVPLRKTEILDRVRKDFEVKSNVLVITLYRKKKYYPPNAKPEPFFLTLEDKEERMLNEVLDWIRQFKKNERPFDFCGVTAWRYTKEVFENAYSHYWRFNYITKAIENSEHPEKMTKELLQETGLDLQTVNDYIMEDERMKGSITKREIEKYRTEGVINA
jgi:hypothetical protein